MSERVPAQNKTSATPSQATQASSPLLHQSSLTDQLSESVGSNSNISKELGGVQPKTIRRSWNWQNITVEAPSRGNGMSLPGGIQRQQEEPLAVSSGVSADSAQKSALELSNSTISISEPAQKPSIARAPLNRRNIPIEAPARSSASSTYPGGIQRLETSDVKKQEESTESLQMQPLEEIQAKSSSGEPQEKEEQNKESVQTKLTVGAPGDKYEQEADSMAAKVMTMPDSALQQPIQRQTDKETEAVQMQPLVNSITPLVQRSSGEEEEVKPEKAGGEDRYPSIPYKSDRKTLIHYTDQKGLQGILASQKLFLAQGEIHARYGDGQYFTDLLPENIGGKTVANLTPEQKKNGIISAGQAAQKLFNDSRLIRKMTHYVEINIEKLDVRQGLKEKATDITDIRENVQFILNNDMLDLKGRIVRSGKSF
jgi:hypothetical protein